LVVVVVRQEIMVPIQALLDLQQRLAAAKAETLITVLVRLAVLVVAQIRAQAAAELELLGKEIMEALHRAVCLVTLRVVEVVEVRQVLTHQQEKLVVQAVLVQRG
jgi:hypothetical protein